MNPEPFANNIEIPGSCFARPGMTTLNHFKSMKRLLSPSNSMPQNVPP